MPQIRKTHNISSYGKNCLKSLYLSRLRNSIVFYAIWQKALSTQDSALRIYSVICSTVTAPMFS